MTTPTNLPNDSRALGIVQLHTDLHERFFLCEAIQKRIRRLCTRKITCYNYISFHSIFH